MEKHYLEYSDPNGAEHKFYEVTIDDVNLTIRYGRIGTDGQSQQKAFPSFEKAKSEADKKIKEKKRKGYEDAVQGVRQKRSITRRSVEEVRPATSTNRAPVLWRMKTGSSAFGIYADTERVWVGNQAGKVIAVDHTGETLSTFQLPEGVKCLVSDGMFMYAGCDDGNVYDLTGKIPFVAYNIDESVDIYWLDIHNGVLGVSDSRGNVYAFNPESENQWGNISQNGSAGWMVRMDDAGVYHGHSGGVAAYDPQSGIELWKAKTNGSVLFGWQDETHVYAATAMRAVQRFDKKGNLEQTYKCDSAVFSCASSPDGEYIFAGDNSSAIYAFSKDGTRLWKLNSGCGSALSMQYLNERLFIVTTDGSLAMIDASPAAIAAAQQGQLPTVKDIKAQAGQATAPLQRQTLQSAQYSGQGVVLKCLKEGGKLRVRVESDGYHDNWNVQFPKDLREEGARYLVDEVAETNGFYRVIGEIRKLD